MNGEVEWPERQLAVQIAGTCCGYFQFQFQFCFCGKYHDLSYPLVRFAKMSACSPIWPKDRHMLGLGEDKRRIMGLGGWVRAKPRLAEGESKECRAPR
jgi:hypothetical protein